jgi:hypothetical protein
MIAISPFLAELADHAPDQLDDVGLDALGRFVHQQDAGPRDQRARDGKLLLLPARQVAAAPVLHLLEDGEQLEDAVGNGTLPLRQAGKARLQVLAHRQQREDHPPLRHVADAHLRQPVRGKNRQVLTVERE